jgi:repressor LexA
MKEVLMEDNVKLIAERLFAAIQKSGKSYGELSKETGIPKSAIQRYATGETKKIPLNRISLLAEAVYTNAAEIMGWTKGNEQTSFAKCENILPITPRRIPMLGTIACGEPIFAEEDFTVTVAVGADIDCDFALRCSGDSMKNARILDGDIVFIKKQDTVEDGEIAAVLIDDDATLKRVRRLPGGMLMLFPENPEYQPIFIGGENETRVVRIIGKAVAFQSAVV